MSSATLTLDRFIPAYTGNSSRGSSPRGTGSVHPRVHGELYRRGELPDPVGGSSPRTRGTPRSQELPRRCPRFIPAYTGNSFLLSVALRPSTVHPRVHGELLNLSNNNRLDYGSSPRTRGTPFTIRYDRFASRFIPAYTGNSSASGYPIGYLSVHPRVHGELSCAYHLPVEHQFRPAGDALRSMSPPWTVPAGFAPLARLFIETPSTISTLEGLRSFRSRQGVPAA